MSQDTRPHSATAGGEVAPARLSFLDALRGLSALAVAAGHGAEGTFPGYAAFDQQVFRLGQFGVVTFFLCSGFIIPASIERHGSLRRFWTGRFFRLFPLYWLVVAAALALAAADRYELDPHYSAGWLSHTVANATMTQALIGAPLALGLSWTLGFELGFYVLISLLFLLNLHRDAVVPASIVALLALGLGLLNRGLPAVALPILAVVSLVGAVLALRHGRSSRLVLVGGTLAVVVIGLMLNRHGEVWLNVTLFAPLFAGTVLYRHFQGRLSGRVAGLTYAGVAVLVSGTVHFNAGFRSSGVSFAAAFAAFGALYALRRRRFPRPLVYLGTISYSVYLLHPLVFSVLPVFSAVPSGISLVAAIAATLLVAALSYRWVEVPMIALGRGRPGKRADTSE